jgi:hypothetical protein
LRRRVSVNEETQGLKAPNLSAALAARLKSCPDTKQNKNDPLRGVAAAGVHLNQGEPDEAQQRDERDDDLGDDAVEAPDLKHVFLDAGEINGKGEAGTGGKEEKQRTAHEGENREQEVSGNADGGDGNVVHLSEGAVVDDAAVPVLIDGAGLGAGVVVNFEGEGGVDNAGQSNEEDEVAHDLSILFDRGRVWPAARMDA